MIILAILSEEPLKEVLSCYNIKVLSIKNECYKDKKGVWWVETSDELKILKKISSSENTLKYILAAVEHLIKNGVFIPKVNKTKTGENYVNINGTCFVLSDAIKGKNPTYNSSSELMLIAKALAKFHVSSEGFTPPEGTKPKYHLGTWIETYTNQLEDMNNFYKKELENKNPNSLQKTIIQEFPYFYTRAQKAIEGLKGSEYSDWVDKVSKKGCLCHQDFAAGNLVMTSTGLCVLDTDSITTDLPARDIRKLLNKIIKKSGKWDLDITKKILNYYNQENTLTPSEWKVVKLDLMFPHLFLGAINKYYYQRDKGWSQEKYHERIKQMIAFEKTINPLLDKFEQLIN